MKKLKKETVEEKLEIVLPPRASSDIDYDLVNLTEYLTKKVFKGKWQGGGLLGGEFGYGVDFENDTFMVHHFCWCEADKCKWCNGNAPNFWHKPSGLKIHWYKWIGRGMEFNHKNPAKEWPKIYKECIKSISVVK